MWDDWGRVSGGSEKLGVTKVLPNGGYWPLQWGGARGWGKKLLTYWHIAHSCYSWHQLPSDTLNCLLSRNTFLSRTYYFSQISEPAQICVKNTSFEEQNHWVPLLISQLVCILLYFNTNWFGQVIQCLLYLCIVSGVQYIWATLWLSLPSYLIIAFTKCLKRFTNV